MDLWSTLGVSMTAAQGQAQQAHGAHCCAAPARWAPAQRALVPRAPPDLAPAPAQGCRAPGLGAAGLPATVQLEEAGRPGGEALRVLPDSRIPGLLPQARRWRHREKGLGKRSCDSSRHAVSELRASGWRATRSGSHLGSAGWRVGPERAQAGPRAASYRAVTR